MTTNQTIDGVSIMPCPFCGVTPKPFSYPQHAPIEVTCDDESCPAFNIVVSMDDWNKRPAAQPQGVPVAWKTGSIIWVYEANARRHAEQYGGGTFAVVPLYAEQPAPVAVVLPERKRAHCTGAISDFRTWEEAQGWNACLDEVARLNSKSR